MFTTNALLTAYLLANAVILTALCVAGIAVRREV